MKAIMKFNTSTKWLYGHSQPNNALQNNHILYTSHL